MLEWPRTEYTKHRRRLYRLTGYSTTILMGRYGQLESTGSDDDKVSVAALKTILYIMPQKLNQAKQWL
ncbi:hypothetical protein CIB48_g11015 [Xylaria polymorpha]|nr:hypothetical protein CIB48_g11015 [Xylaria polymorpha]